MCITVEGKFSCNSSKQRKQLFFFTNSRLRNGFSLFSDLSGFQAPHGGVIPPHLIVTPLRPDVFVVNEDTRVIVILELTCPW